MGKTVKLLLDEIKIEGWIKDLIPNRTPEEQNLLKEDIKANGLKTKPIVIKIHDDPEYEYALVDGHGRHEALEALEAEENKENRYSCDVRPYSGKKEIKDAMLRIQLGRRNLSENAKNRLRAEIWEGTKESTDSESVTFADTATKLEISERQLSRSVEFNNAAKKLEAAISTATAFIEDKDTQKKDILLLAEKVDDYPELVSEAIEKAASSTGKRKRSTVIKKVLSKIEATDSESVKSKRKVSKLLPAGISLSPESLEKLLEVAETKQEVTKLLTQLLQNYLEALNNEQG